VSLVAAMLDSGLSLTVDRDISSSSLFLLFSIHSFASHFLIFFSLSRPTRLTRADKGGSSTSIVQAANHQRELRMH
jgi:hypothetical protein